MVPFPPMRIAVLVLDGVFDTGLAAVLDALALARGFSGESTQFAVRTVGVRRRVKTGQGLAMALDAVPSRAPELVVVPALGAKTPDALDVALAKPEAIDAAALLRSWRTDGARIAAACTATFLLASTGLLDGKAATTTWWLAPAFRERFPEVQLDEGRMIVDARGVVTAGAALAHLDLALWIIRRASPTLARTVARHLTWDQRASQGAYVMPDHVAHADPLVARFEAWARKHLAEFTLAAAARAVGASERTLERKVSAVLGKSPLAFVRDLRVEHARHLLESTNRGIDDIATRVGYSDGVTLRKLLRDKTGRGVRELRGQAAKRRG
jgi:transcriptional regulator GlxA family with amidase domain